MAQCTVDTRVDFGFMVTSSCLQARDYMPGDEFTDNRWRNAWNAVYVAGGWRLVQPNWAAMQVNTKVRSYGRGSVGGEQM